MIDVELSAKPIDIDRCLKSITSPDSGCANIFVGTVRNKTKEKQVTSLEFEAYEPMAKREMKKIASDAQKLFSTINILIYHRVGKLKVGDIPVVIIATSAHRKDAIRASHYIIDVLKKTVPIWKKEIYTDGEEWVSATP